MDANTLKLVVILVSLVVVAIICGVGSAKTGGGFFWGACFGPIGIVVAAILVDGAKTRKHIEVATDALLNQAKAPHQNPIPPRKPREVECANCHTMLTDIPGPGTYQCPECGKYLTVK